MARQHWHTEAAARAQTFGLVKDETGLLAALTATVLIGLGYPMADAIASIVVATIIVWTGISLFGDNSSILLGRSPGSKFLAGLERVAMTVPGIVGVHEIRAEYVGPDTVHPGMHFRSGSGDDRRRGGPDRRNGPSASSYEGRHRVLRDPSGGGGLACRHEKGPVSE